MACGVIYFILVIYYMYVQGKLMKQQKWAYFKSKLNLMELSIILLSWSALFMFINRSILGNWEIEYYQNHKDQFPSFYETAAADAILGYLIAFLVLLATVKMWHMLRLSPKLHLITATLQRAWTDISGSLLMIIIILLAYSIACNLVFGWKLYKYKTILSAGIAVLSLQLHRFNYDEILDYNSVLGGFIIVSCIILLSFVMINLFMAINRVAFKQERIHHKPSEEEEIVHLMFTKFFSLFGIRKKEEDKDQRHYPKQIGNNTSVSKK
ncbi:hypothetical protein UPYG_G00083850 [Umbra pygmaea]|uniref:Polycystin cation channel PKD1/PKD2 domain-containing protein n=1 Tax=Umbra pygmaea TaxID=75934 RepID=A0ABD0XEA4_UMBPY